jgi:hypothetical protein
MCPFGLYLQIGMPTYSCRHDARYPPGASACKGAAKPDTADCSEHLGLDNFQEQRAAGFAGASLAVLTQ